MTLTAPKNIEYEYLIKTHSITIVIPALNEEGNLTRLMYLINETFKTQGFSLPVLVVDDGSTDNTPVILEQLIEQYSFLKVIRHSERRGVTQVWKTVLANVKTDLIFWGQGDLESDPTTDIPLLLAAYKPGIAAVAGWRQNRGDKKEKTSKFANLACQKVFGLKIQDMNWIKLVRTDLLSELPIELITHRYLLAILAAQGHEVIEVETPWHPRYSGKSKFGKSRLLKSALDFSKLSLWWFFIARKSFSVELNNSEQVISNI